MNDIRVGVALSGGSYRALVFHLGVLARLATDRLLENVTFLSTVSGGSLCAALIYASNDFTWPSSQYFLGSTVPYIRAFLAQHNLVREIRHQFFRHPHHWLRKGGNQLATVLSKNWGIDANIQSIADHPRWIINATCYETRKNWRFMTRRMGDYEFGYVMFPDIALSEAVAASAAHPFIGPLSFDVTRYEGEWVEYLPGSQTETRSKVPGSEYLLLWDGGLYDGLGVEALMKPCKNPRSGIDFLVVSDASGPVTLPNYWLGYPSLRRMYDITAYQIQALRARSVMDHFLNHADTGRYIKLGHSADYILGNAGKRDEIPSAQKDMLPDTSVQVVSMMKTGDTLMPTEKFDLIFRHGFEIANLTLYAHGEKVAFNTKGYNNASLNWAT